MGGPREPVGHAFVSRGGPPGSQRPRPGPIHSFNRPALRQPARAGSVRAGASVRGYVFYPQPGCNLSPTPGMADAQQLPEQCEALEAALQAVRTEADEPVTLERVERLARLCSSHPEASSMKALRAVLDHRVHRELFSREQDAWEKHGAKRSSFKEWKRHVARIEHARDDALAASVSEEHLDAIDPTAVPELFQSSRAEQEAQVFAPPSMHEATAGGSSILESAAEAAGVTVEDAMEKLTLDESPEDTEPKSLDQPGAAGSGDDLSAVLSVMNNLRAHGGIPDERGDDMTSAMNHVISNSGDPRIHELMGRIGCPGLIRRGHYPGSDPILGKLIQADQATDANLRLVFGDPARVRGRLQRMQLEMRVAQPGSPSDMLNRFQYHSVPDRPNRKEGGFMHITQEKLARVREERRRPLLCASDGLPEATARAAALKAEGNESFGKGHYRSANRRYLEAADALRVGTWKMGDLPDDALSLFATILSNHAQSCLSLHEAEPRTDAERLLSFATRCCVEILESPFFDNKVPRYVQKKLEHRLCKANEALGRLPIEAPGPSGSEAPRQSGAAAPEPSGSEEPRVSGAAMIAELVYGGKEAARKAVPGLRWHQPVPAQQDAVSNDWIPNHVRHHAQQQQRQQQQRGRRRQGHRQEQRETARAKQPVTAQMQAEVCCLKGQGLASSGLEKPRSTQCPVCHDEWESELAHAYVTVLSCGHAICAGCLTGMSSRLKGALGTCPICRTAAFSRQQVLMLADRVREIEPWLRRLASMLPVPDAEQLTAEILVRQWFDVSVVEATLSEMVSSECAALDATQKQEIFLEAQRPVVALRDELKAAREARELHREHESPEWQACDAECRRLEICLRNARQQVSSLPGHPATHKPDDASACLSGGRPHFRADQWARSRFWRRERSLCDRQAEQDYA